MWGRADRGAAALEAAILAALIAVVIAAAVATIGVKLVNPFAAVSGALP